MDFSRIFVWPRCPVAPLAAVLKLRSRYGASGDGIAIAMGDEDIHDVYTIFYILYIYIHYIYIHYIYIYIHYIYIHYIYTLYIYRYTIYELPPKLYCPKWNIYVSFVTKGGQQKPSQERHESDKGEQVKTKPQLHDTPFLTFAAQMEIDKQTFVARFASVRKGRLRFCRFWPFFSMPIHIPYIDLFGGEIIGWLEINIPLMDILGIKYRNIKWGY